MASVKLCSPLVLIVGREPAIVSVRLNRQAIRIPCFEPATAQHLVGTLEEFLDGVSTLRYDIALIVRRYMGPSYPAKLGDPENHQQHAGNKHAPSGFSHPAAAAGDFLVNGHFVVHDLVSLVSKSSNGSSSRLPSDSRRNSANEGNSSSAGGQSLRGGRRHAGRFNRGFLLPVIVPPISAKALTILPEGAQGAHLLRLSIFGAFVSTFGKVPMPGGPVTKPFTA